MTANALPNAVLGVAYLANGVSFFWRYRQGKDALPFTDALRYVAVVLFLCVLVHAGDALAFYQPSRPLFMAVSVLSAFAAPAAVSGLPGFVRGILPGRRVDAARDGVPDRAAAERERYERLRLQVLALDDTFRRNTWIEESRLAIRQLNEMLSGGDPPSSGGGGGVASAGPAGGGAK